MKGKAPWLSGFCGTGNPPESHGHCKGTAANGDNPLVCSCTCHTTITDGEVTAGQLTPSDSDGADAAPDEAKGPNHPASPSDHPLHGFYLDMPEADYHSHAGSLSNSGLKTILGASPADYLWERQHPAFKSTFDHGSAAHKLVLGVGDPIAVIEAADWRTNAAKEARDAARANHEIPLLRKDFEVVQAMADKLAAHDLAMALLSDGQPEVSAFAVDEETGVLRRCRFDWLRTSVGVDYKTTVDEHPNSLGGHYGTVRKYGYDTQAGFYSDIAADLGHPLEAFAFIFQRKTAPYPVSVIELTDASLGRARERIREGLRIYRDCTESGFWPGSQLPGTYHLIDTDNPEPMEMTA